MAYPGGSGAIVKIAWVSSPFFTGVAVKVGRPISSWMMCIKEGEGDQELKPEGNAGMLRRKKLVT
jgi:hypothetical protein